MEQSVPDDDVDLYDEDKVDDIIARCFPRLDGYAKQNVEGKRALMDMLNNDRKKRRKQ